MGKVLLVVLLIGVAIYFTVRFFQSRTGGGRGGLSAAPPPRPVGPDDDPDFLWKLERDRRRDKKKKDQSDDG